jgi:hypothetical protein
MNWLYYKTGRNIIIPIIFHITAGYFNEIFATHPDSKVIQTILLLIVAIIFVAKEKIFSSPRSFAIPPIKVIRRGWCLYKQWLCPV